MNRRNFLTALLVAPVVHEVEPVRRVYSFLWSNPFAPIVFLASDWTLAQVGDHMQQVFTEADPIPGAEPTFAVHAANIGWPERPEFARTLGLERDVLRRNLELYMREQHGRFGRVELRGRFQTVDRERGEFTFGGR